MKLVVRPAAAADLDDAFRWYEERRVGLGHRFLASVERTLLEVAEAPGRYRVVHRETRRAHVVHFPYGIFYRVIENEVVVVACFHASRSPRRWSGRA